MFVCLRDPRQASTFVTLEAWVDQEAIDRHDAQPHHAAFLQQLAEVQADEKRVEFLDFSMHRLPVDHGLPQRRGTARVPAGGGDGGVPMPARGSGLNITIAACRS